MIHFKVGDSFEFIFFIAHKTNFNIIMYKMFKFMITFKEYINFKINLVLYYSCLLQSPNVSSLTVN
jgi:ABC-type multidrug transport system permease subunit